MHYSLSQTCRARAVRGQSKPGAAKSMATKGEGATGEVLSWPELSKVRSFARLAQWDSCMVKRCSGLIAISSNSLMQQTWSRSIVHMVGFWIGPSCLLGYGYKGLGFCGVWAQTIQCTWYLLCKWHNVAEGACAGLRLVHSSPKHDILHSSIIH